MKPYTYPAKLLKVVDGDTFDFSIDLGFNISTKIRVRVLEYNAPEIRGGTPETKADGLRVKNNAIKAFSECEQILVQTNDRGKYGRWLANIFVDGKDIVQIIK